MNTEEWKENAKLRSDVVEMWVNYKIKTVTLEGIMWNEKQRERLRKC